MTTSDNDVNVPPRAKAFLLSSNIETTYIKCDATKERIVNQDATQCSRLRPVGENDAVLGAAAPL